ncbi:hypothetical protein GCM10012275_12380 [Longimycelium tulufanense]|uniref:Xaa-Pro dipeptidyl-peptidase C-terminal domain-containing protein n=1 Tax=Longimycelium tulufanense TaxID=907463 RepID=A0A8J3FTQ4_9PSEU|nr:CocE/NonD family hydrolase [Longimycelium tulufanense]GGM42965.1 hypothetical protein GCM10012275_12380 [Longimycelium tulufanense]
MRRIPLLLLAALTTLLALVAPPAILAAPGFTTSYETISGDGGIPLKAFVIRPTGRGPGPHPLLVMPASWGTPNIEYVGSAWKLAYGSGYVVVSYTTRGFWDSGGEIEVAGPKDVADARKVIDWAVANAGGDPTRVGMAGISYGGGISLLTAAADQRVRAVAAMSGWADLAEALYPNRTANRQAIELLLGLGKLTGRPGAELRQAERDYHAGAYEKLLPLSPVRSVSSKLDQINRNGTAIMIANTWQDGMFPANQEIDFYRKLTVPKKIMLGPGDHATAELFGAAGFSNEVWTTTTRWLDRHVRGERNGVDGEQPVLLKPSNGGGYEGFADWQRNESTYYLTRPTRSWTSPQTTGSLAGGPSTGWSHRINAGWDTVAGSGTIMITGILQGWLNIPTGVWMPAVNRSAAAVWWGPDNPRAVQVNGQPRLHVTVTPSAPDVSLFAYLYDVNSLGAGSLVSHKPVTLRDVRPGVLQTVDIAMEANSWRLPAGHRLVLVVDTVDPRYRDHSQRGSTVTFDSPAHDPSWLRVPFAPAK